MSVWADASTHLQQLIDQTPTGETLVLPAGRYVGPVTIRNAIHMQGDGQVVIETPSHLKRPAITIQAQYVTLSHLRIETRGGTGIHIENAKNTKLSNLQVTNALNLGRPLAQRGNGIEIYYSLHTKVTDNEISDVHDGIYIEQSKDTTVTSNHVENARYGFHFMYSENDVLTHNRTHNCVTGAMIMGTKVTSVRENAFQKQNENVNAQGILLFGVEQLTATNNVSDGNRVGLYAEQVEKSTIAFNRFSNNRIGWYLHNITNTKLLQNDMVNNVSQVNAMNVESSTEIRNNYWDDFQGINTEGLAISEMPYQVKSPFLQLSEAVPAYLLFFRSPGMIFLENILGDPNNQPVVDVAPALIPNQDLVEPQADNRWVMMGIGLLTVLCTISIYYKGVFKHV